MKETEITASVIQICPTCGGAIETQSLAAFIGRYGCLDCRFADEKPPPHKPIEPISFEPARPLFGDPA
jgi:hypothetical protein